MLSFVEVSFYGLFCYDCELEESENDEIAYLCVWKPQTGVSVSTVCVYTTVQKSYTGKGDSV